MRTRNARGDQQKKNETGGGMDIWNFHPKNQKQGDLWDFLNQKTVTIGYGSAGTGKTLVSLWYGLLLLQVKKVEKVIYVRSDVGMQNQRSRGAVPGTLLEKSLPLIGPLLDNFPLIMPNANNMADYLLKTGKLEIILLEDIRGRSLQNSFILCDESQNMDRHQFKTVLTRVGKNSSVVFTGDTSQADLDIFQRGNGLTDAVNRIGHLSEVGVVEFTVEDIVRNGVLKNILREYD